MNDYSPVAGKDETEIWKFINDDWPKMTFFQKRLWELMRIDPVRWHAPPYKYRPREAWVVGIIGAQVIWYNETWFGDQFDDTGSGFSRGGYGEGGQIRAEFGCAFALGDVLQSLLRDIAGDPAVSSPFPP